MTGVLPLEPHIDEIIALLCQRLEEEFIDNANGDRVCDLDQWILYCQWSSYSHRSRLTSDCC